MKGLEKLFLLPPDPRTFSDAPALCREAVLILVPFVVLLPVVTRSWSDGYLASLVKTVGLPKRGELCVCVFLELPG